MATAAVALASGAQTNSAMDDEAPQQGGFGRFYKVHLAPRRALAERPSLLGNDVF